MTSFSLPQIVGTQFPHQTRDSHGTGATAQAEISLPSVGFVRHELTRMEIESAIEVAELREIFYEQQGQTVLASFMRKCIQQLEAARYPEEKA